MQAYGSLGDRHESEGRAHDADDARADGEGSQGCGYLDLHDLNDAADAAHHERSSHEVL